MSGYRIGIDLGGTKIAGVLADARGKIVAGPLEEPTERERPPTAILDSITALVRILQQKADDEVASVGVGIPTTLDACGGMVPIPNLPTMSGVAIGRELETRLGRPIALENDANCFVYGEWRAGAGEGTDICLGITLGTGIGTGLILGGQIYRGAHGSAGEICYSPFRDGQQIEDIVSGLGISRHYRELTGVDIDAHEIAERARAEDTDALEVWREFGKAFGYALAYAVNILDPGVVVIGGSLIAALDLFEASMRQLLKQHAYAYQAVDIRLSGLGKMAGAVGAAMLPAPS